MAEKEYIEREALLDRVYAVRDKLQLDLNNPFEDGVRVGFENVEIEIENYPAADVWPVVKAEWYGEADGYADGELVYDMWSCPICGKRFEEWEEKPTWNFCPNCGADMREDEE